MGQQNYKLKAYADNVVLTLENPLESVPAVLEGIMEFGKLTGFKLNKDKTKIIVKNLDSQLMKGLERVSGLKSEKKWSTWGYG